MNKLKFLIAVLLFCSCKDSEKPDNTYQTAFGMYSILIENYTDSSHHIEKEIQSLKNKNDNPGLIKYDSLTKNHIEYLNSLYERLQESSKIISNKENQSILSNTIHTNQLFFNGDEYSDVGNEYILKTDSYRENILALLANDNHSNRVKSILNTDVIQDRNRIKHKSLNYHFKDQALIATLAYLKFQINTLLQLELEFLKNCEIN